MKIISGSPKSKRGFLRLLIFLYIGILHFGYGQDFAVSDAVTVGPDLFGNEETLSLKLSYSNKNVRLHTNDSTYIKTSLAYSAQDGIWKTMDVSIRARGNFRRDNCYFPPLKIKIEKTIAKGTLFEGNKKLKLVLPCFSCKDMNDKVIKEYMAYKLYEIVSPYHFKTRLVHIEFSEIRGSKIRMHKLLGILVEDIKNVAARHDGRVLKRHMRALAQEPTTSVRNNVFHFMIGNTDYSTTYQHNQKLLFIDKKMMPVPYDFDMSGLVNADYALVSNVQNLQLNISDVTERMYKGFKRDPQIFEQVRQQFLQNKEEILETIDQYRPLFRSKKEFFTAKKFLVGFFDILSNDKKFQSDIIAMARD